ncbi:MAG: Zn-dependent hydrolase beta-lactamase superfamily [Candidatus Shapirobacteria bacterium GW2011_GWF1_38_23]|nr:MAG: Zn-dependent hydrolase beta-lactamase superfamily [Candidatus Shapirobacteria bacterium GW2011_GWF1_38_23]
MIKQKTYQKPAFNPAVQKDFTRAPVVQSSPTGQDAVRISSLGAFGDVTQNMFVYEFAPRGDFSKSQIIIVDCGVGFPEEDAFGVDLQIPDTTYLLDKKERILGIFITHGHEDHIGAIRYVLPIIGNNIPIFAPKLAAAFIESRLAENQIRASVTIYQSGDVFNKGPFTIEPIRVTHSIPDTHHFAITTPIGVFYHGSDFKFDVFPIDGKPAELKKIANAGNKKVIALMSDSLGADHEGYSPSERDIAENFKHQIVNAKGRVFVTSISSNIVRWGQAIEYGKSTGRKICVVGYSVDKAINIAKELGYIKLADSDMIAPERSKNFPDNKLLFLVAGFAGQPDSALSKMVMGKHRVKIKSGDKVIFSAPDYIPGTTSNIYEMIDILSKMGADVAYGEKEELHVSGHGYQKEHALLITLTNPRYLLPIGGNYRHVNQFITPDFDSAVTFYANGKVDTNFHIPMHKVLIDGLGIGDVGATVLRDRKTLAEDGMFSVVLMVNKEAGTMFKEPIILSRGFVFMKENTDLIDYLKEEVIKKFGEVVSKPANFEYIRTEIQAYLETIIKEKTGREPMVLPLIVEV